MSVWCPGPSFNHSSVTSSNSVGINVSSDGRLTHRPEASWAHNRESHTCTSVLQIEADSKLGSLEAHYGACDVFFHVLNWRRHVALARSSM